MAFNQHKENNMITNNFHRKTLRIFNITIFTFISVISIAHEYKQPVDDLSYLLKQAKDTQTRLVDYLNLLPHKSIVLDPGIKGLKTINQLLQTRWNGDASRITDYARATVGVDNFFQVYQCLHAIQNSTLEIVDIQDHFFNPYPENYRDINIVFKDRTNGHLGEIQINSLALLNYKNSKGHDLFDQIRNIRAKAYQENRLLSFEEDQTINQLTKESILGYNEAFKSSLKINNYTIRVGVYGIITHNGEVLMTRTQSGSKLIYNFPGGGIDENESIAEALIRECQEEIYADVTIKQYLYAAQNLYIHKDFPDFYMFNIYYSVEIEDKEQFCQTQSIEDAKWFPINNLPLDEMLPIDKEFINFYFNNSYK
jgi:8-oxo-dGTP pyrophosphatase MutT (NUDIX family)